MKNHLSAKEEQRALDSEYNPGTDPSEGAWIVVCIDDEVRIT